MNWNKPQSGTLATDYYREGRALAAAHVLNAGRGLNLKSTDHANANELCVEVIARKGTDDRTSASDTALMKNAIDAVNNIRVGNGYHKKQSDHTGSNTCAAVIAAATG